MKSILASLAAVLVATCRGADFDITQFGAKPDDTADDTLAYERPPSALERESAQKFFKDLAQEGRRFEPWSLFCQAIWFAEAKP